MKNFGQMMQKVQEMQEKMQNMQEQMEDLEIEGVAERVPWLWF